MGGRGRGQGGQNYRAVSHLPGNIAKTLFFNGILPDSLFELSKGSSTDENIETYGNLPKPVAAASGKNSVKLVSCF